MPKGKQEWVGQTLEKMRKPFKNKEKGEKVGEKVLKKPKVNFDLNCCGFNTECWIIIILISVLVACIFAMIAIGETGFKHYLQSKGSASATCTYLNSTKLGRRKCDYCTFGECQSTFPCYQMNVSYINNDGEKQVARFFLDEKFYLRNKECSFYACGEDEKMTDMQIRRESFMFSLTHTHTEFDCHYSLAEPEVAFSKKLAGDQGALAAMVIIGLLALGVAVASVFVCVKCWWESVSPS